MTTSQPRQPKGQPAGGQFTGKQQSSDEVRALLPSPNDVDDGNQTVPDEGRTIEPWQREIILDQIGRRTVMAISGGRVRDLPEGVELPVSNGYSVRVRLNPLDYYDVERVFTRAGNTKSCGTQTNVDHNHVSDMAYYASCFHNDDKGTEWKYLG